MPRSAGQKLKLLYLYKIFTEKTDENNGLTMQELISLLGDYGVNAERKSVYDDIESLKLFGADIEKSGNPAVYYLAGREFELPELKLLVDSVQSSKFITRKKSEALIAKLVSMASESGRSSLNRQVYVTNRVKTYNEQVYYTVDAIHDAINRDRQVSFAYYEWTAEKKKRLRRDGKIYTVSPWALTWDDENYYMICFDSEAGCIKHFRTDKMVSVSVTDNKRDGSEAFAAFDMGTYSRSVFGMYGGETENVTLECDTSLAGVVIDRFGEDISFFGSGDRFRVNVSVAVSPNFLSWVAGFGKKMKIVSPESVIAELKALADDVLSNYN